jgi:butyryl-CoA dehydrogenase
MSDEAADFAEAVAAAADRTLAARDGWRPGDRGDDRCPALSRALTEMGWLELAGSAELAPLAGPAGIELGRRLAPLCELDALLDGSPLAGDLIRYGAERAVRRDDGGALDVYAIDAAVPVAYGDAQGVRRVQSSRKIARVERGEGTIRTAAWTAATTGYLAGLSEWALDTAAGHARGRRAFGSTLAALAPVQQRLADAATAARGLRLLAHDGPGAAALAHAGLAAVEVTAGCQQIVGAIGFTLEFPLQRAYRRARAMQLWADAFLLGCGT